MIQLNSILPSGTNASDFSIAASAASQSATGSFQSQLSAALTATLEQFGIDPNKVALSVVPMTGISPFQQAGSAAGSATPAPQSSAGDGTLASQDPVLAFDDAYWAAQPPAVQALRNIDDPNQRSILAAQLAASGYRIDTPIMVWGWDASKVTSLRQGLGYSWVPTAFQNPIAEAPGVDDHGSQPYDPTNPPKGSIAV